MKKYLYTFITALCLLLVSANVVFALVPQAAIDNGLQYLKAQQKDDGSIDGFSGVSDWAAMAFAASNSDLTTVKTANGQSLLEYLQANPPTTSSSSTEWSRRILTVAAGNQNPYDFAGINLVQGLKIYYTNNQIGNTTTVNDDVFGLLALLASKESTSSAIVTDTTAFILSYQHTDGGFSYATDASIGSDIDDTAAAIMALVAAKNQGITIANVQTAVDNAKAYILAYQNADGGFAYDPNPATSWDTSSNVSTTSWVVMALASLGMNSDTQFINAQDYLFSTQQSDGSFPYQPSFPPGDTFDTSFVLIALKGAFWPIHIFSGTVPGVSPLPTPTNLPSPTVTPTATTIPTPTPTSIPSAVSASQPTPTPIQSGPTITPTSQPRVTQVLAEISSTAFFPKPTITVIPSHNTPAKEVKAARTVSGNASFGAKKMAFLLLSIVSFATALVYARVKLW